MSTFAAGLFERGNRARRIGRRIVALSQREAPLGEGGVDRAEDPVRFLVGGVAREGGLGVRDRFEGVVLTRVEASELGAQLRRPGVEGNRALVRFDGLVDAADALEMTREEKVVAGIARLDARLRRLARRRWSDRDREKTRSAEQQKRPHLPDYNDVSRPQDANGIWYSATAGNDCLPRCPEPAVCPSIPNCSKYWPAPTARPRWSSSRTAAALKCGQCKRVYPIKDDIPVMLLDEATVEP